jgi:hypothetical protein
MVHRAKVLEINPGRLRIGSIEMTSETFVGELAKGDWEQVNIAADRPNAIPGPSASSISISPTSVAVPIACQEEFREAHYRSRSKS